MSNQNNLNDEQLKQLIAEAKSSIEIPEPTNWDQVHTEILKQSTKKKRWLTIKQIASISAAAVLISFFISNNSNEVSAQFTSFFKVLKNEATLIFLSESRDEGKSTHHSPNFDGDTNELFSSNEELQLALSKLEFTPPLPKFLPDGFKVDQVYALETESDKSLAIYLLNDSDVFLSINYQQFVDQYTTVRDPNRTTSSFEDYPIGPYTGVLVSSDNNSYTVDWIDDNNIKTTIRTNIDRFELTLIISSLY